MSAEVQTDHVVPISVPDLGPEVEELVLSVLRSGQLAQGPMVERFEAQCARMAGSRYAVAVSNGTASLEAALEVLGVGPGDEVVTTPLTFAATLNAALRTGATVRFADVRDDFTMDPMAAAALANARTTTLLPVHLYGLPADMRALGHLADRHGLGVVEDAAQAHGATLHGRPVGSFGIGSFSFYATKNVAAGEGGVVTTSDPGIARAVRVLRNQGMVERYRYETIGRNLRMTDLQAAVAVPQLERLDSVIARRRANATGLSARLASSPVVLPSEGAGRRSVWHQYTVLLPEGVDRDGVVARMRELGVVAGVYYPRLVWDYEVYRDCPQVVRDDTPRAASMVTRCLSLPVHQQLSEADLDRIASALTVALA